MESARVFKVKYGNTLRRFNAFIDKNGRLDLDMGGLRAKVITLFNLVPDTELTLTYTDEDGDVVTLVNDDDLHDMISQRMNVLRINVQLNTGNDDGMSDTRARISSVHMRPPFNIFPNQDGNAGFSDVLQSVPDPLVEAFSKLSTDLASKAAATSPLLAEVLTALSKLRESYFTPVSPSGGGVDKSTQNGTSNVQPSNNPIDPSVNENAKASHVDSKQDSTSKFNEVGTTGPVSRGVGTSNTQPMDLNFPSFPSVSGISSFLDMSKIPSSDVTEFGAETIGSPSNVTVADHKETQKTIAVGSTSNVTATDHKETQNGNDAASVVHSDLLEKMAEPTKGSNHACGKCDPFGRKWTKKGSVCHKGEKFSGGVASPWNAGCSIPINPDPSHANLTKITTSLFNPDLSHVYLTKVPTDGLNHSASNFGNLVGECPFTGMPVVNNSAMSAPAYHRFKRGYKDAVGGRFHKDVICDGCGVQPITGPRFKSKVKENYDLCSICFAQMGNEADYIRIDWPVRRHPLSFKMQQHETPGRHYPSSACGARVCQLNLDSRFILDVNVIDGTVMAPTTPFTKTWRMCNTGNAVWARGTQLVWIGGDRFSEKDSVEICRACVPIGEELEISVDFIAPEYPGRYISYWRMATPSGERFGQRVWVLIQVDGSMKDLLGDTVPVINLNLPPSTGGSQSPQIIDVNFEPTVHGGLVAVNEPGKTTIEEHGDKDKQLDFLIDDNFGDKDKQLDFLIDDNLQGTSVLSGPVSPSSISYPIIDLSDVAPVSGLDQVAMDQVAMEEASKTKGVQEALLRALDEMGFKCMDFNTEVLRMHDYNLEEAVNHLCGVGEWDPILEELREMGFHDTELNKKLLRKNNGSIKRVVMDLIAVEKY